MKIILDGSEWQKKRNKMSKHILLKLFSIHIVKYCPTAVLNLNSFMLFPNSMKLTSEEICFPF